MATGGHGVRMQYDYTHDTAGLAGEVSSASPRWLRLTRSGDTITGYDSADGVRWSAVGAATLTGLPATVQVGLFAASPEHSHVTSQGVGSSTAVGGPTLATAAFDHVSLQGSRPGAAWAGDAVGGTSGGLPASAEGFQQAGDGITVSGSGDIAPDAGDFGTRIEFTLAGAFAGLIAVIVVAAMFITAEYRRGLIRSTLTASPRRGRVLAAKAVVVGAAAFVSGLAGAAVAIPLCGRLLRDHGASILPVTTPTEVRVVVGTAALFAVVAVLALAAGTVLRRSAGAVTAVIAGIVLPYLLATVPGILPVGAEQWLLRVTPAAGFAVQGTLTRYPQVNTVYTPSTGYFPLSPWAGFAVLCAWAAAALALALFLLRRRDA